MAKQLLIISCIFLFTCSMRTNTKESFEGVLTYKITFTPKSTNEKYNEYQRKKYGDTLNLYISENGAFRREYPTSGEMGFDYYIYSAQENKAYLKWRNQDTLTPFDCSKNTLKLKSETEKPVQTIHGAACKGYCITLVDSNGRPPQVATLTYYYPSNKEYIDPSIYKNHNEFFYNKIMNKIQAPYYKYILDMGRYEIEFELVKIEKKKLDEGMFKISIK